MDSVGTRRTPAPAKRSCRDNAGPPCRFMWLRWHSCQGSALWSARDRSLERLHHDVDARLDVRVLVRETLDGGVGPEKCHAAAPKTSSLTMQWGGRGAGLPGADQACRRRRGGLSDCDRGPLLLRPPASRA